MISFLKRLHNSIHDCRNVNNGTISIRLIWCKSHSGLRNSVPKSNIRPNYFVSSKSLVDQRVVYKICTNHLPDILRHWLSHSQDSHFSSFRVDQCWDRVCLTDLCSFDDEWKAGHCVPAPCPITITMRLNFSAALLMMLRGGIFQSATNGGKSSQ